MGNVLDQKRLEDITENDLLLLIESKIAESKTIDYKQELPGTQEKDRKEFLKDISSFANTAGGYLVFGMKEEQGIAVELLGLGEINPDKIILRFEEMIRSGIRPQIFGLKFHTIPIKTNSNAFIIKIPKSWNSPHQVIFNSDMRFVARGQKGKYLMEIDELRTIMEGAEEAAEKIRNFRLDRIAKIAAGESPSTPDRSGGHIIVHYLPIAGFAGEIHLPLRREGSNWPISPPPHLGMGCGFSQKYCFEGFQYYSHGQTNKIEDYFLLFKKGAMEMVLFQPLRDEPGDPWKNSIGASMVEELIAETISYFRKITKDQEILSPAYFAITIIGMKGWRWLLGEHIGSSSGVLDRDTFLVPETLVDSESFNLSDVLKRLIDPIWNAAGWQESPNFKNGTWTKGK